jgi:hypothetical protein
VKGGAFRASTQSSVDLQSHAFDKEITVLQKGAGHIMLEDLSFSTSNATLLLIYEHPSSALMLYGM